MVGGGRRTAAFPAAAVARSVERLELVRLDGRLVLVQVAERVLRAVVVGVVVRVDRLRLEAGDRVELLDRRRAEARERAEDRALDLGHLGVLHRVHERVLRVRRMVLELLRRVLLTERRNLVEVHLQVVRHLLGELVLRRRVLTALHLHERHRRLLVAEVNVRRIAAVRAPGLADALAVRALLLVLADALAIRTRRLADALAVRAFLRRDQHRLRLGADALAVRALRLADALAVRALLPGLADALAVRTRRLADALAIRPLLLSLEEHRLRLGADAFAIRTLLVLADALAVRTLLLRLADAFAIRTVNGRVQARRGAYSNRKEKPEKHLNRQS